MSTTQPELFDRYVQALKRVLEARRHCHQLQVQGDLDARWEAQWHLAEEEGQLLNIEGDIKNLILLGLRLLRRDQPGLQPLKRGMISATTCHENQYSLMPKNGSSKYLRKAS